MKRSPLRKRKKGTKKHAAWSAFSEFIRRREADEDGMTNCFTCGKYGHWKSFHAGHYIAKSISLALRFDERNVNIQCAGCNTFNHGNLVQYALALKRKFGDGILEQLDIDRRMGEGFKISEAGYQELFEKYQSLNQSKTESRRLTSVTDYK